MPLGIFLVALLPRISGLDLFLTADEDDQIMFAHLFLKSMLHGDLSGALILGYPGVPTLVLGGLGVGARYLAHYMGWLPLPWVEADLMTTLNQVTGQFGVFDYPLDFLLWVRVPMALLAAVCVLGIYLLSKRLLNGRLAVLIALVIAFDPFILAHSRVIHVDAPLSYFMFLSFLAFLLYLKRGNWKWLALSGLFGGLAMLSKTPAALLGPILVAAGVCYALFPPGGVSRPVARKRLILALVGWGVVAVGAFFALWPSMWSRPLYAVQWIIGNIQSVNSMAHPTTGIFWGEHQTDQNPFYYTTVFPYHLTPLVTLGVGTGLVMILAGLIARWRGINSWAAEQLPLALGLVAYIILFIIPISLISRRGDRYILPVFFASGMLAVLALWWLADGLPAFLRRLQITPARLTGLAILAQSFFVLLYHPYYLAYYNPLLGGHHTAPYQINIGWGEGLDLAARYLDRITGSDKPQVAAWYSNQFAPFYSGQTIDLSDHSSALTGEYTVFYINQVQRGFPSGEILTYFWQREPLHVIKVRGTAYAWIYEGPVISRTPPQEYAFPVEAILGGGARLIGVDLDETTFPADKYALSEERREIAETLPNYDAMLEGLPVTLYWETLAKIHGEHNIHIALVDEEGIVWGETDRMILAGLWRPDRWHTGYFLRDEYRLPIDPATPPGVYQLEVSMYDFVTGQSYGVVRNIGQITLTPPKELPQSDDLLLENKPHIPINETLTLIGHTFADSWVPPGAELSGKIFWQADQAPDRDYDIRFTLLGPDQRQYGRSEIPLSEAYPSSQWRAEEIVGAAYRSRIPAIAPPGNYPLLVNVIDPQSGEMFKSITLAYIHVQAQKRNFTLPDDVTPVSVFLNDEIELVGYKLHDKEVAPREKFGLTLYWRSLTIPNDNYTVFVHVMGPDQSMRGQWDSMPVGGQAPTGGWIPGEIIEDHYEVPMQKDAPPWEYDVFVGMYNPATGQRLPVSGSKQPLSDNRVWLTRLQVVAR